jgi:hypothetical protein
MSYLHLIDTALGHLQKQGLPDPPFLERGPAVDDVYITKAWSKSPIALPASMRDFYLQVGNGIVFSWTNYRRAHGQLRFLPIEICAKSAANCEWVDKDDFRNTDDPALAKKTAKRMRNWIPFQDFGNGDQLCIDTGIASEPVVFHKHDWFDGGDGNNGHVLGLSLKEFLTDWSQVCFQDPRYWSDLFLEPHGMNWDDKQISDQFRL